MAVGRMSGRRTYAPLCSGGSAHVGGIDLYYEAAGPELGPTLLFLHESGGSVATWEQQLRCLGGEVRCLALDMPGHGRSEGNPIPSVQAYREWVIGFLEVLAIREPIIVVGLGLGAAVALDLAHVRPDRVAGLVLTGGVPGGRLPATALSMANAGELPTTLTEEALGPVQSAAVRAHWLRRWRQASPAARSADLSALAQYDWSAGLERATCPILFLEGALDPHVSALKRAAGRTLLIPGASALAPMEQPVRYAEAVRDFCTTVQAPPDERTLRRFG
jgi:pimeloyl-ACP methyl ester carboxylesterase